MSKTKIAARKTTQKKEAPKHSEGSGPDLLILDLPRRLQRTEEWNQMLEAAAILAGSKTRILLRAKASDFAAARATLVQFYVVAHFVVFLPEYGSTTEQLSAESYYLMACGSGSDESNVIIIDHSQFSEVRLENWRDHFVVDVLRSLGDKRPVAPRVLLVSGNRIEYR